MAAGFSRLKAGTNEMPLFVTDTAPETVVFSVSLGLIRVLSCVCETAEKESNRRNRIELKYFMFKLSCDEANSSYAKFIWR